jgi:chromosome segregation ATPase
MNGQNLVQANSSAKQDLQNATSRLSDLRKSIENEKIPLASDIGKLEREAQEKRSEVDRLNRIRDNRDANLIQLKEEVKEGDNEIEFIRRILADYSRSWSETTPPAERSILKKIAQFKNDSEPTNRKEQIQSLLQVTSTSANFLQMQAAGVRFPVMQSFRQKAPGRKVHSGPWALCFILPERKEVRDWSKSIHTLAMETASNYPVVVRFLMNRHA